MIEAQITVPAAPGLNYGAGLFLPDDYATTSQLYPLLVFLHGAGEASPPLSNIYNSASAGGPAYLIEHGLWPENFVNPRDGKQYKFIVVSPQSNNGWSTSGDQLESIINYLVATYRVDTSRIYGTGLSAGGAGCCEFAAHLDAATETKLTSTRTHKFAAMVPMSMATIEPKQTWANLIVSDGVMVWGLGDQNGDVYGDTTMDLVTFMNTAKAGTARFTGNPPFTYGHGGWNHFYDPTYREQIAFQGVTASMNIYEWMLINQQGVTPSGGTIPPSGTTMPPSGTTTPPPATPTVTKVVTTTVVTLSDGSTKSTTTTNYP